jgi:hypothetical protein
MTVIACLASARDDRGYFRESSLIRRLFVSPGVLLGASFLNYPRPQ